jgi:transposase
MGSPKGCSCAGGGRSPSGGGDAAFGPPDGTSTVALERKVAELERFCGQLALENAALKKGLSALPSRSGTR